MFTTQIRTAFYCCCAYLDCPGHDINMLYVANRLTGRIVLERSD